MLIFKVENINNDVNYKVWQIIQPIHAPNNILWIKQHMSEEVSVLFPCFMLETPKNSYKLSAFLVRSQPICRKATLTIKSLTYFNVHLHAMAFAHFILVTWYLVRKHACSRQTQPSQTTTINTMHLYIGSIFRFIVGMVDLSNFLLLFMSWNLRSLLSPGLIWILVFLK